jgi:DNA-binding response OmpR family regulator
MTPYSAVSAPLALQSWVPSAANGLAQTAPAVFGASRRTGLKPGSRIILADDEELIGEIVRGLLSEEGHIVGIVPDGEAAVRAVILKVPDLVIMDVMMPGLGGVEAVRQIRASATAHSVPILMLSSRGDQADMEIALRAGADDYLSKPFDKDELMSRVDRLLGTRSRLA